MYLPNHTPLLPVTQFWSRAETRKFKNFCYLTEEQPQWMDNKNWSPVAQDKCKTRKLIFWLCQVSLSRAGPNNTRAIYLKYSLKFSELRVKSTKSGSKWKPWSFEHIFLFIVLSNFEKKKYYMLLNIHPGQI